MVYFLHTTTHDELHTVLAALLHRNIVGGSDSYTASSLHRHHLQIVIRQKATTVMLLAHNKASLPPVRLGI